MSSSRRSENLRRFGLILAAVSLSAACAQPSTNSAEPESSAHPSSPPSPSASASAVPPSCPASGVLITAERGEAAAGYRELNLVVRDCGTADYPLQGRPDIVVLDADRKPLDVAVVADPIHYTASPRKMTLKPGTGAMAVLSWHGIVTDESTAATGAFLSVAPVKGEPRQIVELPDTMDLGNTGRLQTSSWL